MSCKATTKRGQPCRARPLKGTDTCIAHAGREAQESVGFGGPQPGSGRPANPRVVDVLREMIEDELRDEIKQVYRDSLRSTDTQFHGPSGEQFAEVVPDFRERRTTANDLLAWAYGKPKQQTEVSGPDGGPVRSVAELDFSDPETRKLAHELLARRAKRTG